MRRAHASSGPSPPGSGKRSARLGVCASGCTAAQLGAHGVAAAAGSREVWRCFLVDHFRRYLVELSFDAPELLVSSVPLEGATGFALAV